MQQRNVGAGSAGSLVLMLIGLAAVAVPHFASAAIPTPMFNCPKPADIQSEFVKTSLNIELFAPTATTNNGKLYYELAYKDMTQPRICECITSNKHLNAETNQVIDKFTIECGGSPYHSDLVFNSTNTPGVFVGIWNQAGIPILSSLRFPDTIVEVGVNPQDGSYDWVVEFQCIEGPSNLIAFYAFNFYSSTNDMRFFQPMMDAFTKAGLKRFIDNGQTLQIVKHNNDTCWYNKK